MKLLTFILFLLVYAGWLALTYVLTQILGKPGTRGARLFWVTEAMIVLSIVGPFLMIYLLSGLWSLQLVLIFLAAAQLGIGVGYLLNVWLGSSSERSRSRMWSAGVEIGFKHPFMVYAVYLPASLILVVYVVMGAVIHFRYPWNSQVLQVAAVKYTLIGVIFVPNIPQWTQMAMILASEDLDENTRQQVLINQLTGIAPTALFISLALWAFGVGSADLPITFATMAKSFSTRVTILVLAFPILLYMLPYLIGTQRGNRFRTKLLSKRSEFTAKLADILGTPLPARYVPDLTTLRGEVGTELQNIVEASPVLQLHAAKPEDIPPALAGGMYFVEDSKTVDPRFRHLDELTKFQGELDDIVTDLQAKSAIGVVREAERWSRKYENRKAELAHAMDNHAAKPAVLLAVGTLFSALISSILSDVGKTAWSAISSGTLNK